MRGFKKSKLYFPAPGSQDPNLGLTDNGDLRPFSIFPHALRYVI